MGVVYADTLTFLYEGTARLLEQYSPLIETCYGPDWIPLLAEKLQVQYSGLQNNCLVLVGQRGVVYK